MRDLAYFEQRLVDEAQRLREEVNCLPPGQLRIAVEEIAEFGDRMLAMLRNSDNRKRFDC